jgi:hypothetical protein
LFAACGCFVHSIASLAIAVPSIAFAVGCSAVYGDGQSRRPSTSSG